jgi:predicted RNA-binding Zn-ribbon protein involved in translation (DUF1610 family)
MKTPRESKKNPDFVFECNKCGHNLYVDKTKMQKVCDMEDCPECGEETPVFTLIGEGNLESNPDMCPLPMCMGPCEECDGRKEEWENILGDELLF